MRGHRGRGARRDLVPVVGRHARAGAPGGDRRAPPVHHRLVDAVLEVRGGGGRVPEPGGVGVVVAEEQLRARLDAEHHRAQLRVLGGDPGTVGRQAGALATRCATPLGRYEVEQLKLVAVVTGLEDPLAMVQAPTGVGYTLRRGACIGKNGGVVAAVRSSEVVISEWAIRADGTRDHTQTVLRLPKQAALNLEE